MLGKIKKYMKNIWSKLNSRGTEFVGFAVVLLFIMLAAAPYIKQSGNDTSKVLTDLDTELETTLNESK